MKAVLVIDMPTDCIKCHLADGYCWNTFPTKGRADGCPLILLPQKIDEELMESDRERYIAMGYNSVLNWITGETE